MTPKPGGLSSEGLTLLLFPRVGREALVPAETEHGAEGPSEEETLSATDPLHSLLVTWLATEGGHKSSLLLGVGHDVVLCHMHMGLGSPLKYQIHQEPYQV